MFVDIPLPSGHSRLSDWLADKSGWCLHRFTNQPYFADLCVPILLQFVCTYLVAKLNLVGS